MKKIGLAIISGVLCVEALASNPSHLVLDADSHSTVSAANENTVRSIASITKLMTALVVIESNLDLDELVQYKGGIFRNKQVKRSELLESLLIRSDNAAAEALAGSVYGGRTAFIEAMNFRARSLGMNNTIFEDPSGLGKGNTSTAIDIAKLIEKTFEHPKISQTSSSKFFKVEVKNKQKITYMTVNNTNSQLLGVFDNIILSKTGFTSSAGRCLGLMVEKNDRKFIIVILGEKNPGDRFKKAQTLINMVSE